MPKIDAGLLKPESLSNPPPSPEINNQSESEKQLNIPSVISYDDDCLDMNTEDMEIF